MKELIFISSVQKELAAERRALKSYIQGDTLLSQFFDVFLFEDSPASGRRADEVYLKEVDRCDIYLGLLGDEYGYEDAEGISPTEREFDRATAAGKERLVFVKGEKDTTRHPKMLALVRKAADQLVRRRFSSTPELTTLVYSSLVMRLINAGTVRTLPFDAATCPRATFDDLSRQKVLRFLALAKTERKYSLGLETPTEEVLTHLKLLDEGRLSHAAVLLFGENPQQFLVTSMVKCLHFYGTTVEKPFSDYKTYKGTVFEMADQAEEFVLNRISEAVGTRAESNRAPRTFELPREAITEAIANAVAHRDYTSNASVQVMLFRDRLEVWNPGELPPSLTFEDLRKPHASIPRNPLIAEPMYLTGHIERAGTGILDMIGLCKAAGLRPPKFHQSGGQFIQTIWRPQPVGRGPVAVPVTVPVGAQVESQSIAVLRAVRPAPLSISELVRALAMRNKTGNLKQNIADLVAEGLIEHTIPDKPTSRLQKYRLTVKGLEELIKSPVGGPSEGLVGGPSEGLVEPQSIAVMKAIHNAPLSISDLVRALEMRGRTGSLRHTLADLVADELIEYTIPDKPTSRLQKYRLTAKGRARMAKG